MRHRRHKTPSHKGCQPPLHHPPPCVAAWTGKTPRQQVIMPGTRQQEMRRSQAVLLSPSSYHSQNDHHRLAGSLFPWLQPSPPSPPRPLQPHHLPFDGLVIRRLQGLFPKPQRGVHLPCILSRQDLLQLRLELLRIIPASCITEQHGGSNVSKAKFVMGQRTDALT